jgi:hypothetical protein
MRHPPTANIWRGVGIGQLPVYCTGLVCVLFGLLALQSCELGASSHANLDAASTDRKARLAKLAALKRKQPEQDTNAGLEGQEVK